MRKLLVTVVALVSAVVLSSCALWPFGSSGQVFDDSYEKADARMEQIASAINGDDAAALQGMFSPRALEQAGFDERLEYLLAFFPNGGLTWERDSVGAEKESANGKKTELLDALYKVSSDGHEYWLLFKDFTVNETVDPENVGIFAMGVIPWAEDLHSGAAEPFFIWADAIHMDRVGGNGYPGIYVPE